jgi:cyclic-di-AMP phosphodiesterase PgpH
LFGHGGYVLIVFLLVTVFMMRLSREYHFNTHTIYMVSLPVLIAMALQAAMILLADGDPKDVGYLFPAGMIGMLSVLLLEIRLALLLVTSGCLLLGLQTNLDYQFVIVGLVGGYTAVAALATIRKRWELFLASILIGVANCAIILITGYILNPGSVPLAHAMLGFFGGVSSFLVLAILPIFERFGIITDIQLLEMTGLQHPLLRQIEEQAPGTWQHTLNVTKLAEAAATEIGVNYLMVRAGCYYHDVGKVKKPEYFTENQNTAEDKARHDSLKPIMSVRVIMNHVKEGVEMARQQKLPERIIDFIVQHHGTSVIRYFYNKALEAQERGEIKEEVRIEDYRYPGVKPQTIEAAIVMLADAVEATATAKLSARTVREEDIRKVVHVTVLDKFNDGQFDECNLTLRDLNQIRTTFVEVLKSRFHTRIDYPKRPAMANAPREKRPEKTIEPGSSSRTNVETQKTEVS